MKVIAASEIQKWRVGVVTLATANCTKEEGFPSRGQAWSLEASLRCCIRYCWCREFVGLGDGCGFLLGGGEHGLLVGDGGRGFLRWHKHERGLRRCWTIDVDVCDGEKESGQLLMSKKPTIAFQGSR
jgi:hypothetical protein